MKPRVGIAGTGFFANLAQPTERVDDRSLQLWATLNVKAEGEESVWADGNNHSNITRQWAELALWFPSLSAAAGTQALHLNGVQDEDFSSYGGDDSGFDPLAALHVLSHGYMIDKPFYEVWGAHVRFKELLK